MKALDTEWNGYKFRSALEARWAAYFDKKNWVYVYEPQAYYISEVKSGYLPDFIVEGIYTEIKPFEPQGIDREKIIYLTKHNGIAYLKVGDPGSGFERLFVWYNWPIIRRDEEILSYSQLSSVEDALMFTRQNTYEFLEWINGERKFDEGLVTVEHIDSDGFCLSFKVEREDDEDAFFARSLRFWRPRQ
jgi:hypothetical protein